MKKEANVFEEIKKLVHKERWKYKQELTRNTRLLDDLRIDGDDADDFFHAFKEHFKVDLSSLDLRKYFNKVIYGKPGEYQPSSFDPNVPGGRFDSRQDIQDTVYGAKGIPLRFPDDSIYYGR
ncbi:MAG: DUF1493 family protein [Candidatus Scalindua sp.]|nr:DUF1493 family protein [Candidatus Scalindua sp.]